MNLQEILTTKNPDNITDAELKNAAYGLVYGQFDLELQPRQQMLQARLRKIEAAAKATLKPRMSQAKLYDAYRDDSDDDEHEWS